MIEGYVGERLVEEQRGPVVALTGRTNVHFVRQDYVEWTTNYSTLLRSSYFENSEFFRPSACLWTELVSTAELPEFECLMLGLKQNYIVVRHRLCDLF